MYKRQVLTDGEKMLLTPTYHVFEMYTVHHDATLLAVNLSCDNYKFKNKEIPGLSVSASKDDSGRINISLCNLEPGESATVSCELRAAKVKKVSGRVLTAEAMNAHNTFENPQAVRPTVFNDIQLAGDGFTATLPAKSIVVLQLE